MRRSRPGLLRTRRRILSVTNQLRLELDSTTVASWASCAAELTLRVEGRFESGRYFSGDARFGVSNEPPVAAADVVSTAERMPVTIAVLANDSDPEGDPIRNHQRGGARLRDDGGWWGRRSDLHAGGRLCRH